MPTVTERLRERIEAEVEGIVAPYFAALEATLPGTDVPDHRMRLRAAEALLDRAYGKPRQVTEVSGPDGMAIELELHDAEAARLAHEFLAHLERNRAKGAA